MTTTLSNPAPKAKQSSFVDVRSLGAQLAQVTFGGNDEPTATLQTLSLIVSLVHADNVIYFRSDSEQANKLVIETSIVRQRNDEFGQMLSQLAKIAATEKTVQTARLQNGRLAIAIPVLRHNNSTEAFLALINGSAETLPEIVQSLQLFGAFFSQWRGRLDRYEIESQLDIQNSVCHAVWKTDINESTKSLATRFAHLIRGICNAEIALISLKHKHNGRVVALSGSDKFDGQTDFVFAANRAQRDVLAFAENKTNTLLIDFTNHETDAISELKATAKRSGVQALILRNGNDDYVGMCVLIGDSLTTDKCEELTFVSRMAGSTLQWHKASQPGPVGKVFSRVTSSVRNQGRWIYSLPLLLLALGMAVPVPYKIKCGCTVEPLKRRYVVAPFDGRLESAQFEVGDFVQEGAIIAKMDGRDIDLELNAIQTQLKQAKMEEQSKRAVQDYDQAGVLVDEQQRLLARIEKLQANRKDRELVSPTAGQVVSGQLKRLVGQTLTKGQAVAEIAALEKLLFEIEIPDADITHVRPEQKVQVNLTALPGQVFEGTIKLIRPRAEQRDRENVFVAEVLVEKSTAELRPGMDGRAKIIGDHHPLGWNLFHGAWDQLLFRLGW